MHFGKLRSLNEFEVTVLQFLDGRKMRFDFWEFGFCKCFAAMFVVIGLMASNGSCQDLELFSGRGIGPGLQGEPRPIEPKRLTIPGINNFSSDVAPSTVRNPFSGLFKKPKLPTWEGLKPKPVGELLDRSNPLADLIPKRDPNRPNFFQKMNSKSKDFLDKTKGWAAGKGNGIRENSGEPWDNVIRDFKAGEAKLRQQATAPAQPKFRTAEAIGEPKLRF